MSTDGTKPPSIAPKKPATPGGSAVTSPEVDRPRPATGPVSGTTAPSARPSPNGQAASTGTGPSVTERLKRAASSVAETTKNAFPSRDEHDDEPERPARPASRPAATTTSTSTGATPAGPRRVRLAVARVDPWSVMKLSFLLSVAVGIMIVVSAAVIWYTLDGLAVFTSVNDTIAEITGSPDFFNLLEYVAFDRVISLATMIAVIDVVLLTALSTIGAFLYNITAALVGGLHLTLTDD